MRVPRARVRRSCKERGDSFVKTNGVTTSDCCYREVPHANASRAQCQSNFASLCQRVEEGFGSTP